MFYRFYRNIGVKGFVYPASAPVRPRARGSLTVYPRYYGKYDTAFEYGDATCRAVRPSYGGQSCLVCNVLVSRHDLPECGQLSRL